MVDRVEKYRPLLDSWIAEANEYLAEDTSAWKSENVKVAGLEAFSTFRPSRGKLKILRLRQGVKKSSTETIDFWRRARRGKVPATKDEDIDEEAYYEECDGQPFSWEYQRSKSRFMFSSRDFILYREERTLEDGTWMLAMTCTTDDDCPQYPKGKGGAVRAISHGLTRIYPSAEGENSCKVEYVNIVDLCGMVPKSIVNLATSKIAANWRKFGLVCEAEAETDENSSTLAADK